MGDCVLNIKPDNLAARITTLAAKLLIKFMYQVFLKYYKGREICKIMSQSTCTKHSQGLPNPGPGQIALKVKILLVFLCRVFRLLKVKAMESFHRFLPKKTI